MWKNIWSLESGRNRSRGSTGRGGSRTAATPCPDVVMLRRLSVYLSFVRFSHTVFALPFALAGALLAARHVSITLAATGWLRRARVAARSAAMGFNRLADASIDALNPRPANRELPRAAMTRREAAIFVAV